MKISLEDLIKAAQQSTDEKIISTDRSDVERFVLSLNIKEGKHVVKNATVYKAYKEWSAKPMQARSFHVFFAQLFKPYRDGTYRYHMLNYRPIELLNKVDNKKIKIKG
jgi:hypothetical protein